MLYADTSALVKLVLAEEGTDEFRSAAEHARETFTVVVAYAELRAAVAAAIRDGRVPAARRDAVMALLAETWEKPSTVEIDWPLVLQAGDLAERHGLRGYDAVHLAALLRTGEPASIILACWDSDLRRAASGLGYAVFPE